MNERQTVRHLSHSSYLLCVHPALLLDIPHSRPVTSSSQRPCTYYMIHSHGLGDTTFCSHNLSHFRSCPKLLNACTLLAHPPRKAMFVGANDEYCTPPEYVELARKTMGWIDLDPASNDYSQKYIGARVSYAKEDNGLAQPWHGNVWLNPPYSFPLVEQFTERMIKHYAAHHQNQGIVLVNAATDAQWFQQLMVFPACFVKGRISFLMDGKIQNQNRNGQAFFYLGDNTTRFCRIFAPIGRITMGVYNPL